MRINLDDRMAFAALAMRRYPDFPPMLAIEALRSDRRVAGLGALDERRRRGRLRDNGPAYSKWFDYERGFVCYDLQLRQRAATRRIGSPLPSLPSLTDSKATFQVEFVPASLVCRRLPVSIPASDSQRARSMVAAELREARREMRAARLSTGSGEPR